MDISQTKQDTLLAFLTDNMREMETELRAQSIVLEALAQKVIDADNLGNALSLARGSTAMLEFVKVKYAMVDALCATRGVATRGREMVSWREPREVSKLPQ